MSEKEKELQKEVLKYEGVINDSHTDLEKAMMALNELLNAYEYSFEISAKKAVEYANTVNAQKLCDNEARGSWKYISDYKKIMWLVNVARDYCYFALENCNNVYCGGVSHE